MSENFENIRKIIDHLEERERALKLQNKGLIDALKQFHAQLIKNQLKKEENAQDWSFLKKEDCKYAIENKSGRFCTFAGCNRNECNPNLLLCGKKRDILQFKIKQPKKEKKQ